MRRLLLVSLAIPFCARANDTMMTLAAGGLVPLKSTQVSMESEDLEISLQRVSVTYRFRNQTDRDIEAIVGFPLPPINGGDLYNVPVHLPSKDPMNFIGFRVTVDGAPVKTEVESRAFANGRDMTARVQSAGLTASVVAVIGGKALARLSAAQRAAMQKAELIECDNTECFPLWESRIQYFWKQRFPAAKTVIVQHSYEPVVGGSYIVASMDGKSNIEPFCGGPEGVTAIQQFKKRHPPKTADLPYLWEKHISYILTTANNWSGPIGKFRLSVVLESPENLLFTCLPGLQRVSPERYQLERTNFHPDKELEILILR
jgi:hypothetical protein